MKARSLRATSPHLPRLTLPGAAALLLAIAAACGGGGPSVPACREGTPEEASTPTRAATSLTLRTGTYEGTGSPQCISGLGFQPVVVVIKGDAGGWAVWHSASMADDAAADFANGQPNILDAITSLDPGAFSLGKDPTVNEEGVAYYYVAFADSPDIKTGSYAGDAMSGRSITGIGFQPTVVFLKRDGARAAVWRSEAHPEAVASFFHNGDDVIGFIQSFQEDGFVVGSDPFVNASDGSTYHYVAFRSAPGRLASGSYIGDGSDSRDIIDPGFRPDYVWIKRSSDESRAVHRPASLEGSATLAFGNVPNGSDQITVFLGDGFRLGADPSVNFEGDSYYYVAWKSSDSP